MNEEQLNQLCEALKKTVAGSCGCKSEKGLLGKISAKLRDEGCNPTVVKIVMSDPTNIISISKGTGRRTKGVFLPKLVDGYPEVINDRLTSSVPAQLQKLVAVA